jgi:hypothetical protein
LLERTSEQNALDSKTSPALPGKKRLTWVERVIYPVALITAVLGCLYCYWTTTPSYALASIVMSVQNHDATTFQKYIDIDSIAGSAFDELLSGPARSVVVGRMSGPMVLLGIDFLRFFRTDIVDIAHGHVVDFISDGNIKIDITHGALENFSLLKKQSPPSALTPGLPAVLPESTTSSSTSSGSLPSSTAPLSNSTQPKPASDERVRTSVASANGSQSSCPPAGSRKSSCPEGDNDLLQSPKLNERVRKQLREFGLSTKGFRGIKYFNNAGNQAFLGLEFYSPRLHQEWVAEFKMEDCGGYWRVTELSNLNQLVDKYVALHDAHQL